MRRHDDGASGLGVTAEHPAQGEDLGRVESVGRLVEDEKFWHPEHRLCDGQALFHTLAVAAHASIHRRAKVGNIQRLGQARVRARTPRRGPEQLEIASAGEVGEEPRPFDEAADPRQHPGSRGDLLAEDLDLACVGSKQSGDHTERGGLARTVRAEKAEYLALLHRE